MDGAERNEWNWEEWVELRGMGGAERDGWSWEDGWS